MKPFYCLQRTYGNEILLTPFNDKKEVISWDDQEIAVTVSTEADSALKETIQYRLYGAIDLAVDAWIQELKYIPRLVNSALAFLAAYFFFSFVVRDPIPILDEMLLASGAAVAVYLWTAARNRKSELATKKRTELKNLVDACSYTTGSTLAFYEGLLKTFDEMAPLTLADKVSGNDDEFEPVDLPSDAPIIHDYLTELLREQDKNRTALSSVNDRTMREDQRVRLSARLLTQARNRKIDLPLIALCQITAR